MKERKKSMNVKQLFVRTLVLLLIAATALSFFACSDKVGVLTADQNGGYVNNKNKVRYFAAPGSYSVTSYISDEAVALNDGINFYQVDRALGEKWLYSPDFGILLYAEGEKLPTFEDMHVSKMELCLDDGEKMISAFEVENTAKIEAVIDAYHSGEAVTYPGKKANYKFYLKFTSTEYPWLVYNLEYMQYAEDLIVYVKDESGEATEKNVGKNFIYNRDEKRFVTIGDELQSYIDDYYHNTDAK
jgi:hypothetical protein